MSELKPCQMRPERAAEKLQESYDYMTRVMPESKRSQATANLLEAISVAIATLRRAQPSNEPLTLEQLQEQYITCHDCTDAEPSRTVTCGYVCRSKSSPCRGRVTVGYDFCSYGRRKSEGGEADAKV